MSARKIVHGYPTTAKYSTSIPHAKEAALDRYVQKNRIIDIFSFMYLLFNDRMEVSGSYTYECWVDFNAKTDRYTAYLGLACETGDTRLTSPKPAYKASIMFGSVPVGVDDIDESIEDAYYILYADIAENENYTLNTRDSATRYWSETQLMYYLYWSARAIVTDRFFQC